MRKAGIVIVVLILIAAALGGWWWASARAAARYPNIVLISLDTCRPDYLSCYGKRKHTTPNIDALAEHATLFTSAISPVPLTLPAHSSMLTGTVPPYHGVHDNLFYLLAERNVTLAERLKEHDYTTGGVIGAFILDAQFGISQGFDTYDDELSGELTFLHDYAERRGEEVTQIAVDWLDEHESERFFLFLHYYDPHDPYRPPYPHDVAFADDPYAGEINYTDKCVGEVIDRLKALDLYDDSLVIIAGDHGESFGEHGEVKHGYFVYHTTTHVPLLIKLPHQTQARRVAQKVSLIDIVPTILSLLQLPIPDELQGHDLMPLLRGQGSAGGKQRFVYSESLLPTRYGCNSLFAIETQHWKYIQTTQPELYDLQADPGEEVNLFAEHTKRAQDYRDELAELLDRTVRAGDDGKVELDQASRKRLEQLGYAGGSAVVESFEFVETGCNPKDFLDAFSKIEVIDKNIHNGDLEAARTLCEEILVDHPQTAHVHAKLGRIAVMQKRDADAIEHFRKAIELDPNGGDWHNNLGILLTRRGDLQKAVDHLQKALNLALGESDDMENVSRILSRQGANNAEACRALLNLGNAWREMGDLKKARDSLTEAGRFITASDAQLHFQLASAWLKLGEVDTALDFLDRALELDPEHQPAMRLRDRTLQQPKLGVDP